MSFTKVWNTIKHSAIVLKGQYGRRLLLPVVAFAVIVAASGGAIWWRLKSLNDDFITLPPLNDPPSVNIENLEPGLETVDPHAIEVPSGNSTEIDVNLITEPEILAVSLPDPIWTWPIENEIVKHHGVVYWPTLADWRMHEGIDIVVGNDKNVRASAAGRVKSVKYSSDWGRQIAIEHGQNYISYYNAEGNALVKVNDNVTSGQIILRVTGSSRMEIGLPLHVHFSIEQSGQSIDPENVLPTRS